MTLPKNALLLLLSLFFLSASVAAQKGKTMLVIVAHPDDESAFAPVLYQLAKENTVYLVVATDGRLGARFDYKPGDELAAVREKETACACKTLNIQPPVFFKFHEDLGLLQGIGEYHKQAALLAKKIEEQVLQIKPDVIFTFGPDGDTGHYMHRQISNSVTEAILKNGWAEKFPVYYLAWSQKDSEKLTKTVGRGLNTVHDSYYNLSLHFTPEEEEQALQSLDCYKSQLSAEEIHTWKEVERADTTNKLHFRKLTASTKRIKKL